MMLASPLPTNLIEWAALSQIVQFLTVLVALVIAARQSTEASKARELTATNILIEQIGDQSIREIRSWFLHEFKNYKDPTTEDMDKIRKLAVCYDRIGFLIKQKLLPEKALYVWQKDEIPKLWMEITPFVNDIRLRYNRPNYCMHFQYLATEWLKKMER